MFFKTSLYYHRVLSHRAVKLVPALELFFLLGGLIGLSGDPVQWSSVHRFHHQNSDSDEDPHSPKRGFWHSLFGWYLRVHPTGLGALHSSDLDGMASAASLFASLSFSAFAAKESEENKSPRQNNFTLFRFTRFL